MDRVRLAESERRDLRVELLAVARDHLVGSFHDAEGSPQRTAGRIGERLSRGEDGLLPDDARSFDLFDVPGAVGDDPVAGGGVGGDGSGAYWDSPRTLRPGVTASDVNMRINDATSRGTRRTRAAEHAEHGPRNTRNTLNTGRGTRGTRRTWAAEHAEHAEHGP